MNIGETAYMIPTSAKEIQKLGWEYVDIIIFSGDAYIDHPSFGTAVIARVLQSHGYRVAVVPQPNWQDDLRDFRKLGKPRLFFGVTAGAMDSMVNHYTAARRLRSDDSYTPDGKAGRRPDYAVSVYSGILKKLFPDVPVVIGGIEASLRRFAHYDYWADKLFPSVLLSSGADILVYGMGERQIVEIAKAYAMGNSPFEIPQIAFLKRDFALVEDDNTVVLHSYEKALNDKKLFVKNFDVIETQANKLHPKRIVEPYREGYVVVNPPFPPSTTKQMDEIYALPFTKLPAPRYKDKVIPAFDMIKNSITIHRGCFGGCNFCTIAAHQGKFIQSRSMESIVSEVEKLVEMPFFKGVISDIGAPTANMYTMGGKEKSLCAKCSRKSCLFPKRCPNLDHSHSNVLELYKRISNVKGVKHSFVGSGIRYDLFLDENGFLDETSYPYFKEVVTKHTSGWFKVAPEHTEDCVLKLMAKPPFALFSRLRQEFDRLVSQEKLKYKIVPYFISSHPGCRLSDMVALSKNKDLKGISLEQVQDFTPTPMTASSAMFYSQMDTKGEKAVFVEKDIIAKKKQKSLFYAGNNGKRTYRRGKSQ